MSDGTCSAVDGVQRGLVQRIGSGTSGTLQDGAFIHNFLRQRLILINANPFTGIQDTRIAGTQQMADFDLPLLIKNQSSGVLIFNFHVEDSSAYRNDGAGRPNFIVIGKAARMLDLNPNFTQPDFQQVFPIAAIGAEHDVRFGENFEFTAIGDFEDAVAIGTGDDYLFRLNQIAGVQSPRAVVFKEGNLAGERNQFGGSADVECGHLRVRKDTTGGHSDQPSGSAEKYAQMCHYESRE
jgi:hypothetical protein